MKKKKTNWFFRILTFFFVIYVFLFVLNKSGYYEKTVRDKALMTEEKIKEFENDVANNNVIDINSYLPETKDYSNSFTKGANFLSDKIGNLLDNNVDSFWKFIKTLFIG